MRDGECSSQCVKLPKTKIVTFHACVYSMLYNEKYYLAYRCNVTELPCMSQYFLDLFVVLQSHDGGTIQSLGSVLHLQQMKRVLDLRVRSRTALTLAL